MPKYRFVLNQPLAKLRDDGFDPFPMAGAISLGSQTGEIALNKRGGDLLRRKLPFLPTLLFDPLSELGEDVSIDTNGTSVKRSQILKMLSSDFTSIRMRTQYLIRDFSCE